MIKSRVGTCILVLLFCSIDFIPRLNRYAAAGEFGPLQEDRKVYMSAFRCSPINRHTLEIRRLGDGNGRNDEIAILELLESESRLRVLHHFTTRCPYYVMGDTYSRSGRFLVTFGESFTVSGNERDIVIYDLIRGESSAYSIHDFLEPSTIASLNRHAVFPGLNWRAGYGGEFDYERMEYYPTTPRECDEFGLPFVVVDLLTRSVREAPVPDREFGAREPWQPSFPGGKWRCSMGDEPLPPKDEPLRLPEFVSFELDESGTGTRRVFRLDHEAGDYLAVPEADWPKEKLPRISMGMYQSENN